MTTFTFKELDTEGQATLEAIAAAPRFNEWMYTVTSRRLTGRILEIGSGIGNISEQFLRDGRSLMLSDIRENYCEHLEQNFSHQPTCLGVRRIDLVHPEFSTEYIDLLGSFDGIFALNVVEHIANDGLAIHNARLLLREGGRLVILVPAFQALYNGFDRALEHYRRYTEGGLREVFEKEKLTIVHSQYFNLAAIAGWWFSGNILKKETIPTGQMKLYNALVPIFKMIDKLIFNRVGISVIVEGLK
ncbi:MAG: methyltransferase [Saprospiraceae bacterium]|nr:methyltransferase [Saprospiraceae bacterium]